MQELHLLPMAMKTKNAHIHIGKGALDSRGFSLIELMIVTVILGILGVMVGVYINSADAKLRSFAFNLGSRFKQAKFEAVKRSQNVYLDFDQDGDLVYNSYTIWVDNDPSDGVFGVEDEIVGAGSVAFEPGVEIYHSTAPVISGGPGNDGPGTKNVGTGFTTVTKFKFQPNGDSINGTVYFYFASGGAGGKVVAAGPWAITSNTVGRMTLDEWRDGHWKID